MDVSGLGKPDRETFRGGEQEPWLYRGGIYSEFRVSVCLHCLSMRSRRFFCAACCNVCVVHIYVILQRLLPFNGRDDMFPALEKRPDPVKVFTVRPYFASDQVSTVPYAFADYVIFFCVLRICL